MSLLPRSTPAGEGIAAGGIVALLDRLAERSIECHSVMVVRHGKVVAEGWWAPYAPGRPHLLYSPNGIGWAAAPRSDSTGCTSPRRRWPRSASCCSGADGGGASS